MSIFFSITTKMKTPTLLLLFTTIFSLITCTMGQYYYGALGNGWNGYGGGGYGQQHYGQQPHYGQQYYGHHHTHHHHHVNTQSYAYHMTHMGRG